MDQTPTGIIKYIMRYANRTHTPTIKSPPSYTKRFALWPRKLDSGSWVWLAHYYITPNSNGVGRLISHSEYIQEQIKL